MPSDRPGRRALRKEIQASRSALPGLSFAAGKLPYRLLPGLAQPVTRRRLMLKSVETKLCLPKNSLLRRPVRSTLVRSIKVYSSSSSRKPPLLPATIASFALGRVGR